MNPFSLMMKVFFTASFLSLTISCAKNQIELDQTLNSIEKSELPREDKSYLKYFAKRMYKNWQYPRNAWENKIGGTVSIKVTILPDGSIKSHEIIKSSGHKILDYASIYSIYASTPLKPFPKGLENENIDITLKHNYEL